MSCVAESACETGFAASSLAERPDFSDWHFCLAISGWQPRPEEAPLSDDDGPSFDIYGLPRSPLGENRSIIPVPEFIAPEFSNPVSHHRRVL